MDTPEGLLFVGHSEVFPLTHVVTLSLGTRVDVDRGLDVDTKGVSKIDCDRVRTRTHSNHWTGC